VAEIGILCWTLLTHRPGAGRDDPRNTSGSGIQKRHRSRNQKSGIRKDQECMTDIKNQEYQRISNIWQILIIMNSRGPVIYDR